MKMFVAVFSLASILSPIVSLPRKIDEIQYSMSNKYIDLIGFNKT